MTAYRPNEGARGRIEAANAAYDRAMSARGGDQALQRQVACKRHRPGVAMRDGARVAYYEHGLAGPTVFLMHPLFYGIATFQPLSARRRAIDLPIRLAAPVTTATLSAFWLAGWLGIRPRIAGKSAESTSWLSRERESRRRRAMLATPAGVWQDQTGFMSGETSTA